MSLNSRWTDDSKFLLKFFKRFFLIGLFDNDLCLETQQQSQIVEKIPLWDRQILMTAMTFQLQLYKMNCSLLHVKRWHGELTTKNGFFVRLILKLGAHGFRIFPMGGWYQLERESDLSKNYSYGYCLLKQKFNYYIRKNPKFIFHILGKLVGNPWALGTLSNVDKN